MPKVYAAGDQVTAADINAIVKTTGLFAVDAVGTDAYAFAPSPATTTYVDGDVYRGRIATANTGAATVNINGVGAKALVKAYNLPLVTGDLLAGMEIVFQYDGPNDTFQLLSPTAGTLTQKKVINSSRTSASGTGTQTISGVGFKPKLIEIHAVGNIASGNNNFVYISHGSYDGTTQGSVCYGTRNQGGAVSEYPYQSTTQIIQLNMTDSGGASSFDAVAGNIGTDGFDLVWTETGDVNIDAYFVITIWG